MPGLISRFNGFMNQVCAAGDSTCVVLEDVLSLGWDPADFVDEGHFSAKGSATFAERVAAQIRESVARQHLAPRDRTLPGSAAGTAASR
jgi:lysophospholipase L1-like esterase